MDRDKTQTLLDNPLALQGKTISHYRLEEFLGRGGMGVVWKAEDVRLKRPVALKLLSGSDGGSSSKDLRFQIEAQAAAALDHPSVCTVYEIDQDGEAWFIAMAFIEGETLQQKIRTGALSVPLAARIAGEVADGLGAAHFRKIIHRDIKSSNIMVTAQNAAKILDFGLARVGWTPGSTDKGVVMGTPFYMSPEQAQGRALDHRTDIWSLGIVLYEMLAGKPPFWGDYREALFRAVIHEPPPDLRERRPDVPEELAQIVYKALAKSPGDRYSSACELRDALAAFRGETQATSTQIAPVVLRSPAVTAASIAVLPFANLTSDPENEYFSDGLTDELITSLARLQGVRVVSRTSAFAMKGKSESVQQIGAILRAGSVLEGSVRKAGNRLRISVQLINVEDGFPIWSDRYDGDFGDIFQVQEDLARKIISGLRVTLFDSQAVFAHRRPANLEAYKLYLQGQYHLHQLNPLSLGKARASFDEALKLDAEYAPAHCGMARYFSKLAFFGVVPPMEVLPKALAAASSALRINPQSADAHSILGEVILPLQWNRTAAETYFQEAVRLAPSDVSIRHPYAMLLESQGRFEESHLQIQEALDLDPLSKPLHNSLVFLFLYARRYQRAIEACRQVFDLDPNYFHTYAGQGLTYSALGRHDEAIAALDLCGRLGGNRPSTTAYCVYARGVAGRMDEARQLAEPLMRNADGKYIAPSALAVASVGLGEYTKALDYLEQAVDLHDPIAMFLGVLHVLDPLRGEPRFARLLERIGLPASFHPSLLHMVSAAE